MLTRNCSFPKGAIVMVVVEGKEDVQKIVRDFVLQEEVMMHTFQVMNDENVDRKRAAEDQAYFQAAIMAARVKIEGVEVTPELIMDLGAEDGNYLLIESAKIDKWRDEFRSE